NRGMSLSEFKFIFFMEWSHRFLGRLIGLALLVPFVLLLMRRELDRSLLVKFLVLFALLGLQGFLGWFMVRSGLVDIPRVSAYRLVIHLDAALLFLSVAYLFANAGSSGPGKSGFYKFAAVLVLIIIGVQIDLGGFTAGLRAGHVSNTFPLMNGQWMPNGVAAFQPFIRNLFENPVTVHFLHRNFAYMAVVASIFFGIYGLVKEATSRREKVWLVHIAALAVLQAVIGISVVVFQVPVLLASFHQLIAVGMWLAALYLVFAAFRKNKS
ncbi:MAG: COX15/CtaA family protein, partial [Spirochaetia bacterium]|nr:COX15/CtaA family protein [Spirochaetia bacterium]